MPSKLLQEVADYCWSKNFLDVFRNFFAEHAEVFEAAPPMTGGEHNMKYYSLFQVYLKLYESTLVSYLNTLDVTIEEFYVDVREAQNETSDPYMLTFIDCLLASADYESFYKVMSREGEKFASRKYMGMKKNPVALSGPGSPTPAAMAGPGADAKAESKSPSGRYDAKGGSSGSGSKDLEPDEEASDAKDYSHK